MIEYVMLETDDQVDRFRAEMWVRFYEDASTRWAEWLSLEDALLPPSVRAYRAAGGGPPKYGEPLDMKAGKLLWKTQACPGYVVHPVKGGGAIIEVSPGRGGTKSRIRKWAESGDPITIPRDVALLGVRKMGRDRNAMRARTLLGFAGHPREKLVKTDARVLLSRGKVVDRFDDRLKSVEREREQRARSQTREVRRARSIR